MKYALLCLFTHTLRHPPHTPGCKQFLLFDFRAFAVSTAGSLPSACGGYQYYLLKPQRNRGGFTLGLTT